MGRSVSHPLIELTLARLREFIREPGAVFWTFGFPILLAVGLGIAFRHRPPDKVRAALIAEPAAQAVSAILAQAEGIDARIMTAPEAAEALRRGRVDVVVSATAAGESQHHLGYRYDPLRPESRSARLVVNEAIQRGLGRREAAAVTDETVSEPGGRYIDFLIPGLIGLNVMGSSMWGIGYAVALARRRRLLRRLAVTPMRRAHYLLAFMLSRIAFLVSEVAALLCFGWLVFDVPLRGSLIDLGLLALLGGLSFMGLALLVASRTDSTEVASGFMNAVMLPMWLLSGSFFSYERFPEAVHPWIRLLPLTAFNDALRGVINEGLPLWQLWPQLAVLICSGALAFAVALRIFRWQ